MRARMRLRERERGSERARARTHARAQCKCFITHVNVLKRLLLFIIIIIFCFVYIVRFWSTERRLVVVLRSQNLTHTPTTTTFRFKQTTVYSPTDVFKSVPQSTIEACSFRVIHRELDV